MPGVVYRGMSATPAGEWQDGKLLDGDGVGTRLTLKGNQVFAGKSASPAFRVQGNVIHKGAASEPFCRIVQGQVLKGNSYDVLYRVQGDSLLRGATVVVRGPGCTPIELVLAALSWEA